MVSCRVANSFLWALLAWWLIALGRRLKERPRASRSLAPVAFVAAAAWLLGCASSPNLPPTKRARAELEVSELTPQPGTALNRASVISATIHYSIVDFDPAAAYILVPVFASTRDGETFNELPGFRDGFAVGSPTGSINIRYSIALEWDSGKLAKPIVLHFVVLQRTEKHKAEGIGQTPSLTFAASE